MGQLRATIQLVVVWKAAEARSVLRRASSSLSLGARTWRMATAAMAAMAR